MTDKVAPADLECVHCARRMEILKAVGALSIGLMFIAVMLLPAAERYACKFIQVQPGELDPASDLVTFTLVRNSQAMCMQIASCRYIWETAINTVRFYPMALSQLFHEREAYLARVVKHIRDLAAKSEI